MAEMGVEELLAFTQVVLAKFQFYWWYQGTYSSAQW